VVTFNGDGELAGVWVVVLRERWPPMGMHETDRVRRTAPALQPSGNCPVKEHRACADIRLRAARKLWAGSAMNWIGHLC
jgi:hypothetical protein